MKIGEAVRTALQQVRAQRLKSFFAMAGVFLGATFLITVVSVVEGLDRYMEEDFARQVYGLNTITLRRAPALSFDPSRETVREWQRRPALTRGDAEAIRRHLRMPALIAVASSRGGRVASGDGAVVDGVQITAASADFFRIREYAIGHGRLFTPPEDRQGASVVVLGAETADVLFGGLDPLGRTVRIQGVAFRVIGVLERQGSLFGISLDNQAIAPAGSPAARFVNPRRVVDEVLIRTRDAGALRRAMPEVEAIMRARRRLRPREANDFAIETADDSMRFWQNTSRILYIAFPGLIAIALVVAGMVITNIMLVSVVERTREIGVRKAVGARRRDVLLQFLIEAGTLSALGSLGGILAGSGLAYAIQRLTPLPAAVAAHWLAAAVVLGFGVGVVAGVYPAARAARLDPIVALQRE